MVKDYFSYETDVLGGITITDYKGTFDTVEIPDYIGRHPVTYIGNRAFACNKYIKKIIIPDTVSSIGDQTFHNCANLKDVILPKSIIELGVGCFQDDVSLAKITTPSLVHNIPNDCFSGCVKLNKFKTLGRIQRIGFNAFERCSSLKQIHIQGARMVVEPQCFMDCENLQTVVLEELEHIDYLAFMGCEKLEHLVVKFIGKLKISNDALEGCDSLKTIHWLSDIATYDYYNPFEGQNIALVKVSDLFWKDYVLLD